MKTGLLVTGIVVATFMASSCRNPFASEESVILGVDTIEAPATIAANATLSAVFKVVTGGCTRFDHLQVSRSATSATVTAWGKEPSRDKNVTCPAIITIEPHAYEFAPPFSGSFEIVAQEKQPPPKTAVVNVQ